MWYRISITIPIETLIWNGRNDFGNCRYLLIFCSIRIAESKFSYICSDVVRTPSGERQLELPIV